VAPFFEKLPIGITNAVAVHRGLRLP
jgi:hypothetical protein